MAEAIVALIAAALPILLKVVDQFIKTPEQEKQAFLDNLPAKLKEINDANILATSQKDPSAVNRVLNGG